MPGRRWSRCRTCLCWPRPSWPARSAAASSSTSTAEGVGEGHRCAGSKSILAGAGMSRTNITLQALVASYAARKALVNKSCTRTAVTEEGASYVDWLGEQAPGYGVSHSHRSPISKPALEQESHIEAGDPVPCCIQARYWCAAIPEDTTGLVNSESCRG